MEQSSRDELIQYIHNKNIKNEDINRSLNISGIIPSSKEWVIFIDKLLLWFGTLSVSFAVLFFVAYNWNELGNLFKFALVESLIILTIIIYIRLDTNSLSSKATIMASSILLGVLLALVGQTYQTGADPWQLFFYWAVLIFPWVVIARFPAMWVFFIFLLNVSMLLYIETFGRFFMFNFYHQSSMIWLVFIFNTMALIIWEVVSKKYLFLESFWAKRLLGLVSAATLVSLVFSFLWSNDTFLSLVVCVFWFIGIYYTYRVKSIDLFMLSIMALCFSIIIVSIIINLISWRNFELFYVLIIGVLILGLGSGFASWLKKVQKEKYHE